MKRTLITILCILAVLTGIVTVAMAADAAVAATVGTTSYTDLQEAVDESNGQLVKLEKPAASITVNGDVSIDLNGFDMESVTVESGTLYGMDSKTNDYSGTGYGKIGTVSGNVAGLAAESTLAQDGYLMICEGNGQTEVSFHRVNLRIHTMTLRGSEAGVYYNCDFEGDSLVKDHVKQFGIALSIDAVPDEDNLATECGYSYFTDFKAGAGANAGDATSTLLYDVMDESLSNLVNNHRANLPVNGRAYILTKDNRYVFGTTASYSFKWVTQQADKQLSTKAQIADAVGMYKKFSKVMAKWDVDNIESALCLNTADPLTTPGKELKILAITSSFGLNTTQLLYDIAIAEGYTDVTVARLYSSGCSLETHVKNAQSAVNGTPKYFYQYTRKDSSAKWQTIKPEDAQNSVNGADMIEVLQSEEWDIIFIQQGAGQSPLLSTYTDANGKDYIDQLRELIKPYVKNENARFVWNMLWAYQWDSPHTPFTTTFNSNQMAMYNANVSCVKEKVVPRTDFDRIIPTGTALQNARTSYFGDALTYDTRHLNTLGSVIAGYTLYSVLTGQELTEIKLTDVPEEGITQHPDCYTLTLSEEDKLVVLESVNNALKKPFEVTTSQYRPVDVSGISYTDPLDLTNASTAICRACEKRVTNWIEVNQDNLDTLTAEGYFGKTLASGDYHFYLSSDIEYTGTSNSFLHAAQSGINICLHLNENNLTATKIQIATIAGNAKLNIMGTGTVTGNHTHSNKFRGSAIILNAGTTTNPGTVRLYSGTYVQPEGNTQLAPVSTAQQGGLLEIYKDATITGNNNNYSVCINTTNSTKNASTGAVSNFTETVRIYGGTFNRPLYCKSFGEIESAATSLEISGGLFNDGIEIADNAALTLSGAPVISGSGLKLAEGVTVTLGELESGTSIAVDASGAFTASNSKAADYLKDGYFTAVQPGYGIEAIANILYCNETA